MTGMLEDLHYRIELRLLEYVANVLDDAQRDDQHENDAREWHEVSDVERDRSVEYLAETQRA
jgi:hypothetical protein